MLPNVTKCLKKMGIKKTFAVNINTDIFRRQSYLSNSAVFQKSNFTIKLPVAQFRDFFNNYANRHFLSQPASLCLHHIFQVRCQTHLCSFFFFNLNYFIDNKSLIFIWLGNLCSLLSWYSSIPTQSADPYWTWNTYSTTLINKIIRNVKKVQILKESVDYNSPEHFINYKFLI